MAENNSSSGGGGSGELEKRAHPMIDADEVWGCEEEEEERKGKGKRGRKEGREGEETEEAKVNERKTQIRTPEPFREKMSAADSDAALSECSRRRM